VSGPRIDRPSLAGGAQDAPGTTASRPESPEWKEAYLALAERQRRLRAMPAKLKLLGLDEAPRTARILDLCCGSGEALLTLHDMGFRDLAGVDLDLPETITADPRFTTHISDARNTLLPPATFDYVLNIHAMHHLQTADNVRLFLEECYRLLRPGGRLAIVDFPNSPQIRLAFWFFRQNVGLCTPYLKMFGRLVQEEWSFLKDYLPQWPKVRELLYSGRFVVRSQRSSLFYFYLVLEKPLEQ
jgi:ubiquinone/menaquinone biosynthesis C-methylase UbiE